MDSRLLDLGRSIFASRESPAKLVRSAWSVLGGTHAGRLAFSAMIGRIIPYTGTVRAEVERLDEGVAEVRMRDRPELRNHLHSLHAAALFNLVELTANIALSSQMPDDARFIVASMSIDYLKKARGDVVSRCEVPMITSSQRHEFTIDVTITDTSGEVVTRGRVVTLVGPSRV